jgi:hypothetical protein
VRPVSARFLRTIAGSHTAIFRARVVAPGQTGVSPDGTEVSILGGDVKLDAGADIRSTLELQLDGSGMWPDQASDLLAPYGNELFIERGVAYGGGSTEWVSLGYFRINDVEQDDAPDGPIRVSGTDRMSGIVDAKLTDVKQYAAVTTNGAMLSDLVLDAYAAAVIEWDDADVQTSPIGRTIIVEEDRYAKIKELVTGLGKIAYFDYRGVLLVRTPPSPDDPVWTVARGAGGVLVSAGRSLSREGVYNGVLAVGEALDTEPPARGLAVDAGAGSPTLWGGPFGKVPRTYASPLLTTDAQARLAAATVLRRSLGLPYNVDFTAVPNPALEPDDPIAVGVEGKPTVVRPLPLAADSFSRVSVDGWSNSENGDAWSELGTLTDFQINGSTATLGLPSANTVLAALNSVARGRRDADIRVDARVSAIATGASLLTGIALRSDGGTANMYSMRLEFNTAGTVSIKMARHSSVLGYQELTALANFDTYSLGQWWTIRARARGSLLHLKAWPRDEPEPKEWQLAYDDAEADVLTGVRFGLYMWRFSGNTNVAPQWELDNWRAQTAPVEGLRGGELHVIDSLTIPLTAAGAMGAVTREQSLTTIESTS